MCLRMEPASLNATSTIGHQTGMPDGINILQNMTLDVGETVEAERVGALVDTLNEADD